MMRVRVGDQSNILSRLLKTLHIFNAGAAGTQSSASPCSISIGSAIFLPAELRDLCCLVANLSPIRIDELRRNAHIFPNTAHTSFQHVLDVTE
jgi:hypothetical protein